MSHPVENPDFRSLFISEPSNQQAVSRKTKFKHGSNLSSGRTSRRGSYTSSEPGNSQRYSNRSYRSNNNLSNKQRSALERGRSKYSKKTRGWELNSNCGSVRSTGSTLNVVGETHRSLDVLSTEIVQVFDHISESMRTKRFHRNQMIHGIRTVLRNVIPCARLVIFGSCANKLDLPESDVDCFLQHYGGENGLRECGRLQAQQYFQSLYSSHYLPVFENIEEEEDSQKDSCNVITAYAKLLVSHLCDQVLLSFAQQGSVGCSKKNSECVDVGTQSSCTTSSTDSRDQTRCMTPTSPQQNLPVPPPPPINGQLAHDDIVTLPPPHETPTSFASEPSLDQVTYRNGWTYYSPCMLSVPNVDLMRQMGYPSAYYYGSYEPPALPRCFMHEPVLVQLQSLENALGKQNFVKKTQLIRSSMPILRLKVCQSRDWSGEHSCTNCVTVDISNGHTNGHTKRSVVNMIRRFQDEFFEFNYLMITIKRMLVTEKLNETFTGGLGSFPLVCMLVAFLRDHYERNFVSTEDTDTGSVTSSWRGGFSLGRLLMDFLDFYGNRFDPQKTAINVLGTKKGGKVIYFYELLRGKYYAPLYIDHPLVDNKNLGVGCYNISNVLLLFKNAHKTLTEKLVDDDVGNILGSISAFAFSKPFLSMAQKR